MQSQPDRDGWRDSHLPRDEVMMPREIAMAIDCCNCLERLSRTRQTVQRWLPPLESGLRKRLTDWFTGNNRDQGPQSPNDGGDSRQRVSGGFESLLFVLDKYADMMRPHAAELGFHREGKEAADVLGAGLFCWCGQLLFYVSQYGLWSNERQLPQDILQGDELLSLTFDFSLLYVDFDYFLDRSCDLQRKRDFLERVQQLLQQPQLQVSIPGFEGMIAAYRRLLERRPQLQRRLLQLYQCEVQAAQLQRGSQLTAEQYLELARRKGGLTCHAIHTLITGSEEDDDDVYEIGAIVQLLDDMMDVAEDARDGIHTAATMQLRSDGNLDRLFHYTADLIDRLPGKFTLFKPCMFLILGYLTSQPKRYSRRLQQLLQDSIYFDWKRGAHMLPLFNGWLLHLIREKEEVGEKSISQARDVPQA